MKEKKAEHPRYRRRRKPPRRPLVPLLIALLIGLAIGVAASVDIESVVQGDGNSEINIYFGLVNIIENDDNVDISVDASDDRTVTIVDVDESDGSPVTIDIDGE